MFYLYSLSHFEFLFMCGERVCSNLIDVNMAVQLSQHCLLKRLSFLYCISLPLLSEINCPLVSYFWALYTVLFLCVSGLLAMTFKYNSKNLTYEQKY